MTQVVFAEPTNQAARELEAAALEQMGYQAESATWRNAYLQGARELRSGAPQLPPGGTASADVVRSLPLDLFFDYLGVRLNGPRAEGKTLTINWNFSDTGQKYALTLDNSALTYVAGKTDPKADASVTLSRATLDAVSLKQTTFAAAQAAGQLKIDGQREKLGELMGLIEDFPSSFEVVAPKAPR